MLPALESPEKNQLNTQYCTTTKEPPQAPPQKTCDRPSNIELTLPLRVLEEFRASGIPDDLAEANIRWMEGQEAIELLVENGLTGRNSNGSLRTAYLTKGDRDRLDKYQFAADGGWVVWGVDFKGNPGAVPQFKPKNPRLDDAKDSKGFGSQTLKRIKYETPLGLTATPILPVIPIAYGKAIAKRYGLEFKYLERLDTLPRADLDAGIDFAFWGWWRDMGQSVIFAEGFKKALSLIARGFPAIAVRSAYNWHVKGEPSQLFDAIEAFATPKRRVTIVFDRDANPKTLKNVTKKATQFGWELQKRGAKVQIASWNGNLGKGIDDYVVGGGDLEEIVNFAPSLGMAETEHLTRLTYLVDIEFAPTPEKPFMGQHEISIPDSAKLIAIKGSKAVGKTSFLAGRKVIDKNGCEIRIPGEIERINSQFEAEFGQPMPVILLTHRRNLGAALADAFGLPVAHELKDAEEGKLFGYALCADSMHERSQVRFDANHYENTIVIIDEAEQVLWHMLDADTEVAKYRVRILENHRKLLTNVLNSDYGRAFIADADLSDLTVSHILDITGTRNTLRPFVIAERRTATHEKHRNCYTFDGNTPEQWFFALVRAIKRGERPLIQVSGQKAKSLWSAQNIADRLQALFPFASILVIDSETTKDPTNPAYRCTSDLDKVIYGYDIVVASPSIETGVSIEDKGAHFTSVWGLSWGLQTVDAFLQAMARGRTHIPRYIWTVEVSGLGKIGNGEIFPSTVLKSSQKRAVATMKRLEKADALVNEALLGFQVPSQTAWSQFAARVNAGMRDYRRAVYHRLTGEGYRVRPFEWVETPPESTETEFDDDRVDAGEFDRGEDLPPASRFERGWEVKPAPEQLEREVDELVKVRDANWEAERNATLTAESLSDTQAEVLRRANALTKEQRLQVKKHRLENRYSSELTPGILEIDDAGLYPKWRLHYHLTVGQQMVLPKDAHYVDGAIERDGALWFVDVNRRCRSPKIKALESVGFTAILNQISDEPDKVWRQDDPALEYLASRFRYFPDLKDFVAVQGNPNWQSSVRIANSFLKLVGLKFDRFERPRADGGRTWTYKVSGMQDGRSEIFERWLDRDRLTLEKWERDRLEKLDSEATADREVQTFALQGFEGGHNSPHINNNGGFVTSDLRICDPSKSTKNSIEELNPLTQRKNSSLTPPSVEANRPESAEKFPLEARETVSSGSKSQNESRTPWTGVIGRIAETVSRTWSSAWYSRGESVEVVSEPRYSDYLRRWWVDVEILGSKVVSRVSVPCDAIEGVYDRLADV